jgi:type II secretory pathway component PulM
MVMATPFASLRTPLPVARWWSSKSGAEQRIVAGLALVALAALAWWAIWQPVTRDIAVARAANARGSVALTDARRMTDEMAGLARAAAVGGDADSRMDLERVLVEQNLRPALTQLDWKDGRARLVFGAVGYDALIAALAALQREARLRVVEGTLTARVEPGTVRAELVLAR